jgi:hypothetical protein
MENSWVYDLSVTDENLTPEVIRATSQLIGALGDAQGALGYLIEGLSEALAKLEAGQGIDEIFHSYDFEAYRLVIDSGIDQFEAWRRIARGSAIRAALAAGMTLTDIADEFGFSRTYARRLAREAPPPPPD